LVHRDNATAPPYNESTSNVHSLVDAKNFLYIINTAQYGNKDDFLEADRAINPPSWLAEENRKIIDSGFDGVYRDIIDAFEYFEHQWYSR